MARSSGKNAAVPYCEILILLFVVGAVAGAATYFVMKRRVDELKRRVDELPRTAYERAMTEFNKWKQLECENVRREQGEIARREATTELQQWKLDGEAEIRRDTATRSQAVTSGKVIEHFAPYLPGFPYNPRDARFLGTPVDFVVFDGLSDGAVVQVVFVEVRSGSSVLSQRERQIRDAVNSGWVKWEELRVPSKMAT